MLNEEIQLYNYEWSKYNPKYSEIDLRLNAYEAFQYTKSDELKSYPYIGKYNTYPGGGYVFKLNTKLEILKNNLLLLQRMRWIDRQTKAVFIEFSIYNPNLNLFAYCTVVFEFLPVGSVIQSSMISTMYLYNLSQGSSVLITVFNIFYILFILWKTFAQFFQLKKLAYSILNNSPITLICL